MDCVILCTVRWDQAVRSHRVTSSCTSSRHCMRRRNITFLSCLRLSLSAGDSAFLETLARQITAIRGTGRARKEEAASVSLRGRPRVFAVVSSCLSCVSLLRSRRCLTVVCIRLFTRGVLRPRRCRLARNRMYEDFLGCVAPMVVVVVGWEGGQLSSALCRRNIRAGKRAAAVVAATTTTSTTALPFIRSPYIRVGGDSAAAAGCLRTPLRATRLRMLPPRRVWNRALIASRRFGPSVPATSARPPSSPKCD